MIRWLRLLILCTVGLSPFVDTCWADEPPKELAVPDPLTLKPGWWKYFNLEADDIQEKINAVLNVLDEELKSRTELDQTQEDLIELIRARLSSLGTSSVPKEKAALIVIEELCGECELSNFLQISELVYLQKREISRLEDQVRASGKSFKQLSVRTESLLVEYMSLEAMPTKARLSLGLNLMSHRITWLLAQGALKEHRKALAEAEAHLDQLEEALERVVDNVQLAPTSDSLLKEIDQADEELQAIERNMVRAQITDVSEKDFLGQVHLALQQNLARTSLLALHLQRALRDHSADLSAIREERNAWQADLRELSLDLEVHKNFLAERLREIRSLEDSDLEGEHRKLAQAITIFAKAEKAQAQALSLDYLMGIQLAKQDGVLGSIYHFFVGVGNFIIALPEKLRTVLFKIGDTPITVWALLRSLIILTIATFVSKTFRKALKRVSNRQGAAKSSTFYALGKLVHYVLMATAVLLALAWTGIDFTNLAIIGGALSVGIGFGLQSITSNFISGLLVLFESKLNVGDILELEDGRLGNVTEINFQNTLLRTFDGKEIIIPNGDLIANRVINWTLRDPFRRFHAPFGVAYGTDLAEVEKAVVQEVAERCGYLHDPKRPPEVWFKNFGDSSLDCELVYWADLRKSSEQRSILTEHMLAVESALRKAKISVPFPQRDLHIYSWPPLNQKQ